MTHEFDGMKYEKASAHQREWGTKLIAELGLRGTESVLDLGCGDGTLTAQLADLVPQGEVVGIDASQGMIDAARPKERGSLRFFLLDINNLNFTARFDIVFSNATLHWVKDHRRLLQNVRRALRDGGRLRFNFAADGNCATFITVIRETIAREEYRACFSEFEWPWYMPPRDEYQTLAEASGLQDVHVWDENADRYFPDEDAMVRWIDQPSIVPFLALVADRQKQSFRDCVVHRMIAEARQADGGCFETFRRINVSARK